MEELFTKQELMALGEHRDALTPMVNRSLWILKNVVAAKIAGHFKMEETLDNLRDCLLEPRSQYGWEGPDYSKLENNLADNQFMYSVSYLQAIEEITGKPIYEAIILTPKEVTRIESIAANKRNEYYYWALWMKRKMKMDDPAFRVLEEAE
jgi:hypothetical protein